MSNEDIMSARIANLNRIQELRKQQTLEKVNQALDRMQKLGMKINFSTLATEANVSQSYLYKYPEIKTRIAEIRNQQSSMPRPRNPEPSSAKSNQVIVSRLKDRIKKLEAEVTGLRNINEGLAGRVYRVSELEALVERQQKYIKDIEDRLRGCESRNLTSLEPPADNQKVTSIDKKRSKQSDSSDKVKSELAQLGIQLNSTLTKTIKSASFEIVIGAIEALKKAMDSGEINNPGGWLNAAIKDGWIPNEKHLPQNKVERDIFDEWFKLARDQGLIMASMKGDDGQLYVFTKDGVRVPYEQMLAEYPLNVVRKK